VPKSTILNLCAAMLEERMIRRSDGGYQLDHRLAQLGTAYLKSVTEVEEFYELCRGTFPMSPQTIQLGVLGDGLNVVFLARHDGRDPLNLGLASEIGRSVPAHSTATGKALLAAIDEDSLASRLPADELLPTLTPNTLATQTELRKELAVIRRRGYSTEQGEIVAGLRCYGVAIRTPRRADGFIGVSFSFPESYVADDFADIPAELQKFGASLADRVGGELAFCKDS
jgi:DNA-binding IclR family transcriptional regulator